VAQVFAEGFVQQPPSEAGARPLADETPGRRAVSAVVLFRCANEATHFSFFDAEAGGHGVLPSLPKSDTIPNTVKKLKPFLA
jgi:hypothetical protein